MSMKKFSEAASLMAQELLSLAASRAKGVSRFLPRIFPTFYKLGVRVPFAKTPPRIFISVGRLVMRNRFYRPFTTLAMERHRFNQYNFVAKRFNPLIRRRRVALFHKDALDGIKKVFQKNARYNDDLNSTDLPDQIDAYEFGQFLGQGCNAAVYAARLVNPEDSLTLGPGFNEVSQVIASEPPNNRSEFRRQAYPYAVKLMFNFEHDRVSIGDNHLWRSMGTELAMYPKAAQMLRGRISDFKPLPKKHPNVVRVHTAFIDSLKVMPDAMERYPDALHTARWYESIASEPKTMYIVMRRYRQTLKDYVWTHQRNYWVGRVMLAQLLEACAFLQDHFVAQRDMKSDNILLQYDDDEEIPHLVVADFGCALACGSWEVKFEHQDDNNLGGNLKTRAPEVATATAGPGKTVNFKMADTWAAGGLAYEIFTRVNPFYEQISTVDYLETELPQLPKKLHHVAKDVVRDLLRRDPNQRVTPHVAANAINLSLFRFGSDVQKLLADCGLNKLAMLQNLAKTNGSSVIDKLGVTANRALDNVMALLTAETITATLAPQLVSRAEKQLRATFLSRVTREDLWTSLHYFFKETALVDADSLASLAPSNSPFFGSDGSSLEKNSKPLPNILPNNKYLPDSNGIVHRVRSK
ncbi:unnamed protein product [Caenorhabditis auriculariae]|uniref:non-specific serine/threonine protein kinase n=1 Tax=Caenorhabditis auriculariae TaxID=2777116 RepID=A0A8S1HGM8_9PELO|nr:unnamed protein product [Caenorhabditis auriculariae]